MTETRVLHCVSTEEHGGWANDIPTTNINISAEETDHQFRSFITASTPSCAVSRIIIMARSHLRTFGASTSWFSVLLLSLTFTSFCQYSRAAEPQYVQGFNEEGESIALLDYRKPALYTQNFGDCLGSSLINVTRFDAAYYKDNMTVLFHLQGNTAVRNESLMSTRIPKSLGALEADRSKCTLACLRMARADSILLSIPAMRILQGKKPIPVLPNWSRPY